MAATVLASAGPAWGAPPNDDFSNAQSLGAQVPVDVPGSNYSATVQAGEAAHASRGPRRSVWYTWTAPSTQQVRVDVCSGNGWTEADVKQAVAVYTGSQLGALTSVVHNGPSLAECRVTFTATMGQAYAIVVDNSIGGFGGTFTFSIHVPSPPANDDFAGAMTIPSQLMTQVSGTNRDATAELGEPSSYGAPRKSVWYRWVSPANASVTFRASGPYGSGTRIGVFAGTNLDDLDLIDSGGTDTGSTAYVHFHAYKGEELWIAGDTNGREGTVFIEIDGTAPPANNDLADAQTVGPDLPVSQSANNYWATEEIDEPFHYPGLPPSNTLWFAWTAPTTGTVTFDTCDTHFDTVLAVYTGTSYADLDQLATNDDGGVLCTHAGEYELGSSITMNVVAGTRYLVAVDGYHNVGDFTLGITEGVRTPPAMLDAAASPATAVVGSPLRNRATISGGNHPTGTLTFKLYGPDSGCGGQPVFSEELPVTGSRTYYSSTYVPTAPGLYYWDVRYGGDAQNNPAWWVCGLQNSSVVVSKPAAVAPPGPPTAHESTATCVVPRVVGRRLAAAERALHRAGCRLGRTKRTGRRNHIVLSQSPKVGAILPEGGRVNLMFGPPAKKQK